VIFAVTGESEIQILKPLDVILIHQVTKGLNIKWVIMKGQGLRTLTFSNLLLA
jgi:hypothetical protein